MTFRSLEEFETASLSPLVYVCLHTVQKNLIDAYAKYGETNNLLPRRRKGH